MSWILHSRHKPTLTGAVVFGESQHDSIDIKAVINLVTHDRYEKKLFDLIKLGLVLHA